MPSETSRTPTVTTETHPPRDGKAGPDHPPGSVQTPMSPPAAGTPRSDEQSASAWPRLRPIDHLFILLSLTYTTILVIPVLPRGIFMGDPGELQLAADTLGITHAPGYPAYVTLGYLARLVPGDHSTFEVTLAFTLSGLIVLWLCMMCQIRLGLSGPIACIVSLSMLAHPRTWWSLLAPEVYFLSLTFQAAAAYLLIKYAQLGRRRDLWWAAVCYGVALANRPPLVLMLPFVLAGWWVGWRRHEAPRSREAGTLRPRAWMGSLATATLAAALPGVYSLAYLYIRDTPETKYNYIENWNQEHKVLPDADEGFTAKVERVAWHTSGREFGYAVGDTLIGTLRKLKWVRNEFFLYRTRTFCIVLAIILLGGWLVFRRSPAGGWLLAGMVFSALAFVCLYRMWGQAADLLPMVWACTVAFGVALAPVFKRGGEPWRNVLAIAALLACLPLLHQYATERIRRNPTHDAEEFLAAMDMETLPANSVIVVSWPEAPPVLYQKRVRSRRDDIEALFASVDRWAEVLEPYRGRPAFAASHVNKLEGFRLSEYRNLQRMEWEDPSPDSDTHDRP